MWFLSCWERKNCLQSCANSQNDYYFHSKRQPRTMLSENSCHFVNLLIVFARGSFFLSMKKITQFYIHLMFRGIDKCFPFQYITNLIYFVILSLCHGGTATLNCWRVWIDCLSPSYFQSKWLLVVRSWGHWQLRVKSSTVCVHDTFHYYFYGLGIGTGMAIQGVPHLHEKH